MAGEQDRPSHPSRDQREEARSVNSSTGALTDYFTPLTAEDLGLSTDDTRKAESIKDYLDRLNNRILTDLRMHGDGSSSELLRAYPNGMSAEDKQAYVNQKVETIKQLTPYTAVDLPATNSDRAETVNEVNQKVKEESTEQILPENRGLGHTPAGAWGMRQVNDQGELGLKHKGFSSRDRAVGAGQDSRDNSSIRAPRTAEERSIEHFQRMADRLNNREYWRGRAQANMLLPGGQASRGGFQGGGERRAPVETEDMRQQELSRQRRGMMEQYEQVGRLQEANQIMNQIAQHGEISQTDLEKLRNVNDESIRQLLNAGQAEIYNRLEVLASDVAYDELMQEGTAKLNLTKAQLLVTLSAFISGGYAAGFVASHLFGGALPPMSDLALGKLFESAQMPGVQAAYQSLQSEPDPYRRRGRPGLR